MRLDNSARMNFPGTIKGNWAWRVGDSSVWQRLAPEAKALKQLAAAFDRLPPGVKIVDPEDAIKANGAGGSHSSNGTGVFKAVKGAVGGLARLIKT